MSSTKFEARSDVELFPSTPLSVLLAVGHLLAAVALSTLEPSWVVLAPGIGLIAWSGVYHVRRYGMLTHGHAVIRLTQSGDESWTLKFRNGVSVPARLRPGSFVHPTLMVLNFLTDNRKRISVVIVTLGDEPDPMRHLRVALRSSDSSEA